MSSTIERILIFSILFFLLGIANAQTPNPVFTFDKKLLRFDKVNGGEILRFTYPFENTGNAPLIISNIKVACTCTQTEWPTQPIMPGKKDSIQVSFNTTTVWGFQDRTLDVYSNTGKEPMKLRFKVKVINKEIKTN